MTQQSQEPQLGDQPEPQEDTDGDAFAVYDKTLARFVGGVIRGKDAQKRAKATVKDHPKDHDYEVRGV